MSKKYMQFYAGGYKKRPSYLTVPTQKILNLFAANQKRFIDTYIIPLVEFCQDIITNKVWINCKIF